MVMARGIMLSHMENTRYIHGGQVYRESIKKMLTLLRPPLAMEEIFVHRQDSRAWRVGRQLYDLLTSPFSKYPAKVNHFRTAAFRKKLASHLASGSYSLFVINGAEMLWCLDLLPPEVPILYISLNIEHRLYAQQVAKYAAVPIIGWWLHRDAAKFMAFELENLKRLRTIVAITAADREALADFCPHARIETIMPSFAYAPYQKKSPRTPGPLRLGFLGNLEWWPNRRSLQWFLAEIFPKVTQPLELHLYGQGSTTFQAAPKIQGHGFIKDLSELWASVDLMIQPITCGAGINIKVAEALYNRMPIIATPFALRGMPVAPDAAIAVLTEPQEWIAYLNGPDPGQQALRQVAQENADLFALTGNSSLLERLLTQDRPTPERRLP